MNNHLILQQETRILCVELIVSRAGLLDDVARKKFESPARTSMNGAGRGGLETLGKSRVGQTNVFRNPRPVYHRGNRRRCSKPIKNPHNCTGFRSRTAESTRLICNARAAGYDGNHLHITRYLFTRTEKESIKNRIRPTFARQLSHRVAGRHFIFIQQNVRARR